MTIFIKDTGDLEFYQGDNGTIRIAGIPTDQDYQVFFAIKTTDTNEAAIPEMVLNTNKAAFVDFVLTSGITDSLDVPAGQTKTTYVYAVKICNTSGLESTVIPRTTLGTDGNPVFGKAPKVIVHAKQVSGTGA